MAEKIEYDIVVNGKKAKTSIEGVDKAQSELESNVKKSSASISVSWTKIGLSVAAAGAAMLALASKSLSAEKAMFGLNSNMRQLSENLYLMGADSLEAAAGFVRTAQSAGLSEQAIAKVTEQAIALGRLYPHESTETFIDNLSMLYSSGEAQGYIVDILEQKYGQLDLTTISLADKMATLDEKVRGVNTAFNETTFSKIDKISKGFSLALKNIGDSIVENADRYGILDDILGMFDKFGIGIKEIEDSLSDAKIGVSVDVMKLLAEEAQAVRREIGLLFEQGTISAQDFQYGLAGVNDWLGKVKVGIEAGLSFNNAVEAAKGDLNIIRDETKSLSEDISTYFDESFGKGLTDTLLEGSASFTDFADSILRDIARIIIQKNISDPLGSSLSGFIDGMFSSNTFSALSSAGALGVGASYGAGLAQGGVFSEKRFASGGVVTRPTRFANGALVAERNRAEGILPLERTASGDLGVKANISSPQAQTKAEINFNVQAIDSNSFNSYLVNNKKTIEQIINSSLTTNGSVRRTIKQVG